MAAARDTRVRLTALLNEGYSKSQAAGTLGMAKTTSLRWARRYLGNYLGSGDIKLQENGESYIMLSYKHCILRLTQLEILNLDDWDGKDM